MATFFRPPKENPFKDANRNPTDKYITYDDKGQMVTGYHSQDELSENMEQLRQYAPFVRPKYNELNEYDGLASSDSFQEEAQKIIDKYDNLQGNLYSEAGKREEKRKELNELAQQKKQEAEQQAQAYQENKNTLLENIDRKLNAKQESLTSYQVAEINLSNSEWYGKVRGDLYTLNSAREIEHEFNTLANQSQEDRGLNRFLTNNYYLFMDKVSQLDISENEKHRAINNIKRKADQLERANYSKEYKALQNVREQVKGKTFGATGAKKTIDSHLNYYLKQFKE